MKCPKCGYLGFETGDRCRNCGYDFSLHTPSRQAPELPLNSADGPGAPLADFDLDRLEAGRDTEPAARLDFDRLIGAPEPETPTAPAPEAPVVPPPAASRPAASRPSAGRAPSAPEPPAAAARPVPNEPSAPEEPAGRLEAVGLSVPASPGPAPAQADSRLPLFEGGGALEDDTPLITSPRPLRPPLAVRRATPEVPRSRPRTTRSMRREEPPLALSFEPERSGPVPDPALAARASDWARIFEPAPRQARLGAAGIDMALLAGIGGAVLYLTLRLLGLEWTDARVLPPVPLAGFLLLLDGGYLAAFTAAGGQTIGKMAMGIRVIGDDGRAVDAAGAVLRAVGCGLSLATLGVGYLPAVFSADGRTLQDRLAGTRVITDRP